MIGEQYSRIPVYEQDIDQITGFVHVRDMFEVEESERERRTVRELMRAILFVPETKPVNSLMRQMQQENTHMVIVVDEYGNTAGLATMEDLLEVIIGEIRDEHEPDSDVTEDGQGRIYRLRQFRSGSRRRSGDGISKEEDIESTTVGGLVGGMAGARSQSRRERGSRRACTSKCWPSDDLAREPGAHREGPGGFERESIMSEKFKSGFRFHSRASERRQVDAIERADRAESGHRGR